MRVRKDWGVVKQLHPDGKLHPICFHSRKLKSYEENYTITELECLSIVDAIDKFYCYLHGTHFIIHSDHAALQWLKTIKNPKGRLFRWSLKLSMYDYEVKYQKGSTNYEADMLSRNPTSHLLTIPDIIMHQGLDNICNPKYENISGVLTVKKKGLHKIVVPPSLRKKLIEDAHEQFGHPGQNKMLELISPYYYWKEIITDISNYVKHCEICQINKKSRLKKFGYLDSLPPSEHPFDLVSIDTIGGLSGYNSTKKYIHLVIDHATRYIWTFSSKSQTTDSYINCLKQIFNIQIPKQLLSDRNPSFTSSRFKKFLKIHNIKQLLTSTQRPQCNGLNERTNQTIITKLKCRHHTFPKVPWPKLLEKVTNEYNESPHSSTKFSPTYLLFGKLPYSPPLVEQNHLPPVEEARKIANENILKSHNRSKQRYDINYKEAPFKEGDLVLVESFYHPDSGKLTSAMTGPYKIIKKLSDVSFEINKPNQALHRNTDVIHSSKLRPYYPPEKFEIKD